tara:strand:+ start:24 stop:1241 length:1218 start_codon:yes stop_codon:yes gene_type:complete
MAEDIKVSAVDEQPKSIAEKEETVLENAGISTKEDGMYKLDLNKINEQNQQEDAVQEQSTDESVLRGSSENEETGQEAEVELQEVQQEKETPIVEEITDEQETSNDETAVVAEQEESKVESVEETEVKEELNLPENIQDLIKFMEETGGSLEDYARLNADYSNVDDNTLLTEYYKQTKPHLSYDEIQFLMEDEFSFDEEIDEEKTIKRKKLAHKEAVANAKDFLTGLKDQYYKEVKLGSKLLPEQQKAIDFFNRYNTEQKSAEELLQKQTSHFQNETNKVFNDDFKGFNFKVGDKKFRFNVSDVNKVKSQNLSNVFDKYVNENQLLNNAADFHKSLFAASNPDALANHFYEQGKADAIKQMTAEAKNINMDPRKTADGYVEAGGVKVRAVSGDSKSGLKLKLKNY